MARGHCDSTTSATSREAALKRNQQTDYSLLGVLSRDAQTAGCGQEGFCEPGLGEKEKKNKSVLQDPRILKKIEKADPF